MLWPRAHEEGPCPPERETLPGGGIDGQIGGDDGEESPGIAHRDGAGDHPDLTAARVKVGGRPYFPVGRRLIRSRSAFALELPKEPQEPLDAVAIAVDRDSRVTVPVAVGVVVAGGHLP